ncbi:Crp/Fnr family transcriptional regulator [Rhizobium sp. YIM 134829]|uniref:Crp/Fnr family transcriptional regulator n=1 Tax=Rhizobium sp. YIM 134829 TaxID=3390453 RepID=UPI00397E741D
MAVAQRRPATDNRLLKQLPHSVMQSLSADFTSIALPRGTVIAKLGQPVDFVYFFTDGIGSVIVRTPTGNRAEAGLFGLEGYLPISVIAGIRESQHDMIVQVDAEASRLSFDAFSAHLAREPALMNLALRAVEVFTIQLAYTAASNAIHDINVRLARWLLMCHDRLVGDEIRLTHDFLSIMLAVRRSSVTTALHVLEGEGLIRSSRGSVVIRDRKAMEIYARDAYGQPEAAFRRLIQNDA